MWQYSPTARAWTKCQSARGGCRRGRRIGVDVRQMTDHELGAVAGLCQPCHKPGHALRDHRTDDLRAND